MEQNKKVIHITESELHDIIRESVNIILEGQGLNRFFGALDDIEHASDDEIQRNIDFTKTPTYRLMKNDFIRTGDPNHSYNHKMGKAYKYYDENGHPTNDRYDADGEERPQIKQNVRGALGRAASMAAIKGATHLAKGFRKLNKWDEKQPWSPFYTGKSSSNQSTEE